MFSNKDGFSRSVVNHFNKEAFIAKCCKSSINYDIYLCEFDENSSIPFDESITWKRCDVCFDTVFSVGKIHGVEPSKDDREIMYSQVSKKQYQRGQERRLAGENKR